MEEARIAFSKHGSDSSVIPVYLDGTGLPAELLDIKKQNYFSSDNAAEIAAHVALKISKTKRKKEKKTANGVGGIMKNEKNKADTQIFIQNYNGE